MMNTEDLYRLLRAEHVRAQGIVDTVADPMLVLDNDLTVLAASRAFFEAFGVGRSDTIGRPLRDLGDGQWDIPDLQLLLMQVIPRSAAVVDFEVTHDFPGLGARTMLVTARRLYHPDNAGRTMLLTFVDATERLRHDAANRLLMGELRHRFRNLGSLARAITRRMKTEGRTVEDFRDAFLDRLAMLIRAEELAFGDPAERSLKHLLEQVLAPFGADRGAIVLQPVPDVPLDGETMRSLAIVLHELATNAAKYGALSSRSGQVHVGGALDGPDHRLRLTWKEQGGPPPPSEREPGFGTELLQSTIRGTLDGELTQDFAEDGLRMVILLPLAPLLAPA